MKGACALILVLVNLWVALCIGHSRVEQAVTITKMWFTLCVILCVCMCVCLCGIYTFHLVLTYHVALVNTMLTVHTVYGSTKAPPHHRSSLYWLNQCFHSPRVSCFTDQVFPYGDQRDALALLYAVSC